MRRPARAILAWPLVLGLASVGGLVLGLIGDGLPDIVSWLLLGALPLVIAGGWHRRTRRISLSTGRTQR